MKLGEAPHDQHRRCSECFTPIPKSSETGLCVYCREDGNDPEVMLLREIFGGQIGAAERERVATDELARQLGHWMVEVKSMVGWRCSCGLSGYAEPRYDKSAQRAAGRAHLRDMIVQG